MTIDIHQIHGLVSLTGSFNNEEALHALKDLRALLEQNGARLEDVVHYAVTSEEFWRSLAPRAKAANTDSQSSSAAGLPTCRWANVGGAPGIETGPSGGTLKQWTITGAGAANAEIIAERLKDALVVATINSCGMKIKLKDIEDERGKIVETLLQAEYDKDLAPIILWTGGRGDAATLAATLRQAVAHAKP